LKSPESSVPVSIKAALAESQARLDQVTKKPCP
jgi:hypothetical protein